MKISVIVCIIFLISCMVCASSFIQADILAADKMSAQYRTGEIDPALAAIPYHIRANIFIKPEQYLEKLVNFFASDADNDYHIVKRIHDWIADNIAYQFGSDWRIYNFLKSKKTNCTGYSSLFRTMTKYAGISSKTVFGYSRTYQYANGRHGNHAWNIVIINGKKYLVDITHDRRMRIHGGEFGEKGPYADNELFIDPQYKIWINLPYSEHHQLIEKPISYDEYINPPRKGLAFIKYGLKFANPRYKENIVDTHFTRPNSKITGIYDGINAKGLLCRLTIECPEDVEVSIKVGDFDTEYPEHATFYRRGKHIIFLFSAPEIGTFMTTISARYKEQERWDRVYTFILVEEDKKSPEVLKTEKNRE